MSVPGSQEMQWLQNTLALLMSLVERHRHSPPNVQRLSMLLLSHLDRDSLRLSEGARLCEILVGSLLPHFQLLMTVRFDCSEFMVHSLCFMMAETNGEDYG